MSAVSTSNVSGRRWARWTLTGVLFVSMVGNVAHTVLATSTISLLLRVPTAVFWPLLTFALIEVIIRISWGRGRAHKAIRAMLIVPMGIAVVTSYEHLNALLILMGERPWVAMLAPGAVDVAMIGLTLTILFTRAAPAASAAPTQVTPVSAPIVATVPTDTPAPIEREHVDDWSAALTELSTPMPPAPMDIVDAPTAELPTRERRERIHLWNVHTVLTLIDQGLGDVAVSTHDETPSRQTVGRVRAAYYALRRDPNMLPNPAWRLVPEVVSAIRKAATR